MAYSTIQKKKCKCGCNRWPTISCDGYNFVCAPQELKDKIGTRRKLNEKNKRSRSLQSAKLHQAQNEVRKKTLNEWFNWVAETHSDGNGCKCWECGSWIPPDYMRHATAHLLPKKLFKSVETHELNFLILGAGCGCHAKTDRLDKFIQLRMWPEAARRIKIMMPLLPFEELQYISSQLLVELDKIKT